MHEEWDDDPAIDLTPMIDVIFMLIIFFVMSMTFSKPVLDVVLPSSTESHVAKKGPEMLIAVREDGSVWVDSREVTLDALEAMIDGRPETQLNLFIDEKAPFRAFVKVVDIAKKKRPDGRFVISTKSKGSAA